MNYLHLDKPRELNREEDKLTEGVRNKPSCLLGFFKDKCFMDDGSYCYLRPVYFKRKDFNKENTRDN